MDQITVDCGTADPNEPVRIGDEVVLLGQQYADCISPGEMATKLDTISYEVTCAIAKRVPRAYSGCSW